MAFIASTGFDFLSYPTTSLEVALPSVDIEALSADAVGGLWIGYHVGGISYLSNDGHLTSYTQRNGLGPNSAQKFVVRSDGSVWALGDNRLLVFRGGRWEDFGAAHGLPTDPDALAILRFEGETSGLRPVKRYLFYAMVRRSSALYPTDSFMINDFAEMPDGKLWVSDGWHSIHQLEPNLPSRSIKTHNYVRLLADPTGILWMARDYRGVSYLPFSPASGELPRIEDGPELTSQQTNAILQDSLGNVWVGTSHGLDRLSISPIKTLSGMRLEFYPALAPDATTGVWVGALAHPLLHISGSSMSRSGRTWLKSHALRRSRGRLGGGPDPERPYAIRAWDGPTFSDPR